MKHKQVSFQNCKEHREIIADLPIAAELVNHALLNGGIPDGCIACAAGRGTLSLITRLHALESKARQS